MSICQDSLDPIKVRSPACAGVIHRGEWAKAEAGGKGGDGVAKVANLGSVGNGGLGAKKRPSIRAAKWYKVF